MKQFLLTTMLALLSIVGAMAQDFTATTAEGYELKYTVLDAAAKTVECTGINSATKAPGADNLVIPQTVSNNNVDYKVTSIGESAFYNTNFTGSLTIPNSVTNIGAYAFWSCDGLTGTLTIPEGVTNIGQYAFSYCSGFTGSLTIGNSVTSIGERAFEECDGFTGSLTIPNSVTSIGERAFRDCTGFTGSLTIGNSITNIGWGTFDNCKFTGTLTIPNSVTSIGYSAFSYCTGFTGTLTIPNSVTSIDAFAFLACTGFTGTLTIPNSVASIGKRAFYKCSGITSIIMIGETPPAAMGSDAFKEITKVSAVGVPVGAASAYDSQTLNGDIAGDNLWQGLTIQETFTATTAEGYELNYIVLNASAKTVECTGMNEETKAPGAANLVIPQTVSYSGADYKVTSIGNYAFDYSSGFTGTLTIPNSVTNIGDQAFFLCTGFTGSLTLPNSLTSIGYQAFFRCRGFTGSLTIPNGVTSIERYTFAECEGLTGSLTIGNSVTSIDEYAFSECIGVTSLVMQSETPPAIKRNAFNYMPNCSTVMVPENATTAYDSQTLNDDIANDNLWQGFTIQENLFTATTAEGYELKYAVLDEAEKTIECIGVNEETKAPGADNLVIHQTVSYNGDDYKVTSVGDKAFAECSGFTGTLTIPEGVTNIGKSAFDGCIGFTGALTIPNSVTNIGERAFFDCRSFIGSLIIPKSVTNIGSAAFYGCSGLTTIDVDKANANYSSLDGILYNIDKTTVVCCLQSKTGALTLPNSVTSINAYAFTSCKGLNGTLTIPEGVTYIGQYAFSGCSGFTGSLTIPKGVTNIGISTFNGCSGLTGTLTIPGGVTSINAYAFQNCSSISGLAMQGKTPPTTIANDAFDGMTSCYTVSVPAGAVDAYDNQTLNGDAVGDNLWQGFTIEENIITATTAEGYELKYTVLDATAKTVECIGINEEIKAPGADNLVIHQTVSYNGADYKVTSVGDKAFDGCSGFTGTLTIPEGVTNIGHQAFFGCRGFRGSLIIPNSVTSIGNYAFFGCSSFTGTLTIPANVTSIGISALSGCGGLTAMEVDKANANYSSLDDIIYNKDKTTLVKCLERKTGSLTIPNSVTNIGFAAFSGCRWLTGSLTIPEGVTIIESWAFSGCSGFTGILTLPEGVTSIESYAFNGCSGFTGTLSIPNGVKSIETNAFQNCRSISGLAMQGKTPPTTIASNAFAGMTSCSTVFVPINATNAYDNQTLNDDVAGDNLWQGFTIEEDENTSISQEQAPVPFIQVQNTLRFAQPTAIAVYNISGTMLYKGNVTEYTLPSKAGIYIISTAKGSYKVMSR